MTLEFIAIALTCRIDRSIVAHELIAGINWLLEGDFQRMIVDLLQARNFLGLTLRVFFRTLDLSDIARWWERLLRIHYPGVAPDNVICCQRLTVMENCILTQLVSIDELIVRNTHICCEAQNRLVLIGIPIIKRTMNGFRVKLVLCCWRRLNIKRREAVPIRRNKIDDASWPRLVSSVSCGSRHQCNGHRCKQCKFSHSYPLFYFFFVIRMNVSGSLAKASLPVLLTNVRTPLRLHEW
ncbi:hypothetical protein FQZ97_682240 [compost metagenome]